MDMDSSSENFFNMDNLAPMTTIGKFKHNLKMKLEQHCNVVDSVQPNDEAPIKQEYPDVSEDTKVHVKEEVMDEEAYISNNCLDTGNSVLNLKAELDLGKLEVENDYSDLDECLESNQPVELTCQICDLSFPFQTSYNLHIKTAHSSHQNMTCKFCSAIFDDFEQFNFHFFSHLKKKKCYICKVPLNTVDEHRNHYWLEHFESQGETIFLDVKPDITRKECPKCGAIYDNKTLFKQHLKSHDMFYPCEVCDKKFSDGKALKSHVVRCHTDIRNHVCKFCQKTFAHQKDLSIHVRTHDETKKFKCDSCNERFNYRLALKSHVNLIHKNICPYQCQSCEKSFPTSIGLSKHRRKHETEKKMECYLCGLKFKYSSNLFDHLRRCHPDRKPITCTHCNKNFSSPLTLKKHSRLHALRTAVKEEVLGC